eukprot:SAG11_NODE_2159_length_3730_cov_1.805288_6_plen_49_part_00
MCAIGIAWLLTRNRWAANNAVDHWEIQTGLAYELRDSAAWLAECNGCR